MTPRETGRLLEAIERGTLTSTASAAAMKTILGRQQAGSRRLPHFLDVPVAHKTGDSGVIANDVGLVSTRSGTVIISFFVNGIAGSYGEAEDRIGLAARQIVDYFDGTPPPRTARRAQPHYDRSVLLETTAETSANASIGDVNGDGHADIVLAKGRHWPLVDRVLLGDGRGGFPTAYDLGTASDRSYSGHLVDLDRDGDLDVVISNDDPDPKLVYLNDGTGHFRPGSNYGRPEWSTRNATIADLNTDGLPDIVVANRTGGKPGANYICLNRGQGQFDAACQKFSGESATTITAADVTGDSLTDLVVPHRDGGQSHVYVNAGNGTFPLSARVPFGPATSHIRMSAAADLNGDGRQDLVAIDEKTGVAVYYGDASHRLSAPVPIGLGDTSPYALALADLDGDGTTDLGCGLRRSAPGGVLQRRIGPAVHAGAVRGRPGHRLRVCHRRYRQRRPARYRDGTVRGAERPVLRRTGACARTLTGRRGPQDFQARLHESVHQIDPPDWAHAHHRRGAADRRRRLRRGPADPRTGAGQARDSTRG